MYGAQDHSLAPHPCVFPLTTQFPPASVRIGLQADVRKALHGCAAVQACTVRPRRAPSQACTCELDCSYGHGLRG